RARDGDGVAQHRVARERAVRNREIDAGEILIYDAASPDIEVTDLRIAHLALGKADAQLGRDDLRMRPGCEQTVPVGLPGAGNRVGGRGLAAADAVENDEHHGTRKLRGSLNVSRRGGRRGHGAVGGSDEEGCSAAGGGREAGESTR